MTSQEKADISRKFIETLLQVPVAFCNATLESFEDTMKQFIPGFLKSNLSLTIKPSMINSLKENVLYHITDYLSLNFTIFLYDSRNKALICGPYLTDQPNTALCERILLENRMTHALLIPFTQYCLTLPVITNSAMLAASRTALSVVTDFKEDIPYMHYQPEISYKKEPLQLDSDSEDDASMELIERRYHYEKLMLQEVAQGNQRLALEYYGEFTLCSRSIIRKDPPLRTAKNLSFSLNTLLRKSAESSGIHPVNLDILSNNFAMMIERANNLKEQQELKSKMISVYCRFVQKYRLDQYSPLIRKTINYIHVHLSDHLSLEQISSSIHVSSSYLSRKFNEEVADSLSNYIAKIRIDKAAELLSFTEMPIHQLASYVGFSDLNYFSRCFKKLKGMTPTNYRVSSSLLN